MTYLVSKVSQFLVILCCFADSNIGYRVAQVRVVFRIPEKASNELFRADKDLPRHLAYVEWFSNFGNNPDVNHRMYGLSRAYMGNGKRLFSVVPVADIRRSVHLYPDFGEVAPREWTTNSMLDDCDLFFLNPFPDRHSYITLY